MNQAVRKMEVGLIFLVVILLIFIVLNDSLFNGTTGMASLDLGSAQIENEVIEEMENNDFVDVVIIMNEPEIAADPEDSIEKILKNKKEEIDDIQEEVLSQIDYVDLNETEIQNVTDQDGTEEDSAEIEISITGNAVLDGEQPDLELEHKYETVNQMSGKVSKQGLERLSKNPNVKKIVIVKKRQITLTESIPLINATGAHGIQVSGINITGLGQTICILDTGVDYNHSDLGGGWGNKVIDGYDIVNDDPDPWDDNGHGTHVAGIAAANGTLIGVAPDAKIIAMKVCDNNGTCNSNDIIAGIDWCVNNASVYNISVITMSLGGSGPYNDYCDDSEVEASAIDSAVANDIFVDASSGNNGWNNGISSPACIKNATSVGSTDDGSGGTTTDDVSSFSNTGTILDLMAPGAKIESAVPPESECDGNPAKELCDDSEYEILQGTSMAAPHVAGAAALIYQYERLLNNRNATPSQVSELLKRTGVMVTDSGNGLSFPRIDIKKAIDSVHRINESENYVEDISRKARITFSSATDLDMASEAFVISNNLISLNASVYPEFNKSAELMIYSLPYNRTPVILKNGEVCTDPECNITSYDGNLSFKVNGFSNYSGGVNAELYIFDDVDNGTTRYTHENILFYANYTNRTSDELISTADCNITFNDGINGMMVFINGFFQYNRTFTVADLYYYNITCNDTYFETLNLTDSITVLPGCGLPSPDILWNITNQSVNCTGQNLLFQNQSLLIGPNGSFKAVSSNISMNVSAGNITVLDGGNFTVIDSRIQSKNASYSFNVYIYGDAYLDDITTNQSQMYIEGNNTYQIIDSEFNQYLYLRSNSTNKIRSTTFNSWVWIEDNSVNTITSSYFSGRTTIYGNSFSNISDSTLATDTRIRGNSVINFTLPQSEITTTVDFRETPIIWGYIDMPSSGSVSTGVLTRYYPIQVNYTSGRAIAGRTVNITNESDNSLLWSDSTDSKGLVNALLYFTPDNYTENLTVSVNPEDNISALSDTPVQFSLDTICGDNFMDPGEECDGSAMPSTTCEDLGYYSGTLGCAVSCTLDVSGCSNDGSSTGGGGGFGCSIEWNCTEWSECINGKRTRTCSDTARCSSLVKEQEQDCKSEIIEKPSTQVKPQQEAEKQEVSEEPRILEPEDKPVSLLWLFIPAFLIVLVVFMPRRVVFAEEHVLKELIKQNKHKKYSRIHVLERIYEEYKDLGNIKYIEFKDKHKPVKNYLKEEYELDEELAELIALAHHKMISTVLTKKKIPKEIRKKFKRVKFRNPLEK